MAAVAVGRGGILIRFRAFGVSSSLLAGPTTWEISSRRTPRFGDCCTLWAPSSPSLDFGSRSSCTMPASTSGMTCPIGSTRWPSSWPLRAASCTSGPSASSLTPPSRRKCSPSVSAWPWDTSWRLEGSWRFASVKGSGARGCIPRRQPLPSTNWRRSCPHWPCTRRQPFTPASSTTRTRTATTSTVHHQDT